MQARRHVPIWRKKRPVRPRWVPYPLVGATSIVCVVLMCVAWFKHDGLAVPISIQLARREWDAWTLLALLAMVASILIGRLARYESWGSALALTVDLGLLAAISNTDPQSVEHLFLYLCAAVVTAGWLWSVARDMEDKWLSLCAFGAVCGALLSFTMMGLGERILVCCALGGMNLLYYGYFVDD